MLAVGIELLAQLPESNVYVHPLKLAGVVAVFVCWAFLAQWVDKDTVAVNTYRVLWNLIFMAAGAVGTGLALLLPNFLVGYLLDVVLVLATAVAYVIHRNGLVREEDTILTLAHFRRIQEQGLSGKKKKQVKEVKERVRLNDANNQAVAIPEDELEREQYRLTQDLLFDAFWRRAEVMNVVPAGQTTKITFLIDGIPTEREGLPRPEGEAVVQYLKKLAGLNLEERRKPQRGKLTAILGENRHTLVVETAGSTAGERLKLRVVGAEGSYKVKDLGFTDEQLQQVRQVMEQPKGLVLLTGPSASGVTTTVYSFVRSHDAFLQNIQILEYDREVEVENVTQHLYVPRDDRTFSDDLLRIVRSDPDIIVFPEMRDREAAALATKAAVEKAKVYVGFGAEDVFEALRKWTTLVGDKALVAKGLLMISNQRLVRRLCSECKEPYKPDAAMLRKLNMPADTVLYRQPEPQYDKRGNPIVCQACQGTGYVGRVGVFETLIVDEELRQVIRKASSLSEVQNFVAKRGRKGLQARAMEKVLAGVTSIQEIVRVMRGSRPTVPPASARSQAQPRAKTQQARKGSAS